MIIKEFIDKNGTNLIIEYNKTNIIFRTDDKNIQKDYYLTLYFNDDIFEEILNYLINISENIWNDFKPKKTDSISSDHEEYYDKKYDNNGYLRVLKENGFKIEKPYIDCPYMYKFNKRRMESFIYDLNK
jgi:hypothetical protein